MSDLLTQIKENWLLLSLGAVLIIWYADTNSKISALAQSDKAQDVKIEEIYALKTDIAVIKANVEFIKARIQ